MAEWKIVYSTEDWSIEPSASAMDVTLVLLFLGLVAGEGHAQAARRLRVSESTVRRWRTGDIRPLRVGVADRLRQVLPGRPISTSIKLVGDERTGLRQVAVAADVRPGELIHELPGVETSRVAEASAAGPSPPDLPSFVGRARAWMGGIPQDHLADLLGIAGGGEAIRQWERGASEPTADELRDLLELMTVGEVGYTALNALRSTENDLPPGRLAELAMVVTEFPDQPHVGRLDSGLAFVEAAKARELWTDADEAAWRTFVRLKEREISGYLGHFPGLSAAKVPLDVPVITAYIDAEIEAAKRRGAANPVQSAWMCADRHIWALRLASVIRPVDLDHWIVAREAVVQAGAFDPDLLPEMKSRDEVIAWEASEEAGHAPSSPPTSPPSDEADRRIADHVRGVAERDAASRDDEEPELPPRASGDERG